MDEILKMFGEEHYSNILEQARRFWQGEGRYVISVNPVKHNYRQLFDLKRMEALAELHLADQAAMPGISLPIVTTDWGTISTARYWGGKVQFDSTGGNIFVNPVAETIDQALAKQPVQAEDAEMDAARSIEFYCQISKRFNTSHLWLRTPDMQGPLNTAGLVLNQEEFFRAMYHSPGKVHAFLEKVTGFLVEYQRYLRKASGHKICGNIWPYTFFPEDLGVSLTEDLMPLLSTRLYREFGLPCLKSLAEEFGGLHIHCCGRYRHHVQTLLQSGLNISALEFHYPEMQVEDFEPLSGQVVLIPYIILHKQAQFKNAAQYYRYLLENYAHKFRFWFACAEDDEDLLNFAWQYGKTG